MDELTPRSRALLDRARAARQPSAEDKARVQARVLAAIASGAAGTAGAAAGASPAAGAAAGGGATAASAAGSAAATGGGGAWVAGVVTALTVGGLAAGGIALQFTGSSESTDGAEASNGRGTINVPAEEAPPVPAPSLDANPGDGSSSGTLGPRSSSSAGLVADEGVPAADDRVAADSEEDRSTAMRRRSARSRGVRRAPSARPRRAERPAEPADLAAEVALLRDADAALQADEAARALALIRVHARRFPDSQLWAERDATRILALCALDRIDDARRLARAWMARAGASPLRSSIKASCAYR